MNGTSVKDPTVSIMKGIAILSVVIGHATTGTSMEIFVNQYHLAVFFFVAGYCFNIKHLQNLYAYSWRRFSSLYVPFMKFGCFYLISHNLFYYWGMEKIPYDVYGFIHEIRNFTIGLTSEDPLMGAMWFCPALLIVSLLSAYTLKLQEYIGGGKREYSKVLLLFCLPLVGSFLSKCGIKSPRCLWEYMQFCGIFFCGHYFRTSKVFDILRSESIRHSIIVIFILTWVSVILFYCGFMAYLQATNIVDENVVVVTFVATINAIIVYHVSLLLKRIELVKEILCYIGNHSFSIMGLHFLCFKLVSLLYILYENGSSDLLNRFPTIKAGSIWIVLYVLFGTAIPLLLNVVYSNVIKQIAYYKK